jgi:hypothetical protein
MKSPSSTLKFLGALLLAASAATAVHASSNPPEGSVAINYSRCDGKYDSWGVHLFQRGPGGPAIAGVSWASPMEPNGKTDFGVFWHVKLSEFPDNKVNYIIHKGDSKEQGGKDMQFNGGTSKEIWVLQGDRKIYTSLDDAKAARTAEPCK